MAGIQYKQTSFKQPDPLRQTAGKIGKLFSNVGTFFNAPQLSPGGLGAQLQAWGGQIIPQAQAQTIAKIVTPSYQLGTRPGVQYSDPQDQAKLAAWEANNRTTTTTNVPTTGTDIPTDRGGRDGGGNGQNDEQRRQREMMAEIDAAYDPAMNQLNDFERNIMEQTSTEIGNTENRYNAYLPRYAD